MLRTGTTIMASGGSGTAAAWLVALMSGGLMLPPFGREPWAA